MKRTLAFFMVLLMAGFASAHAGEDHGLDVDAGMVAPDSPVYGLEVAWDNAAVSIGLKKAGDVAQERAAEAEKMAAKGDYTAAQKAAEEMNKVAQKAKAEDTTGLNKAISVLETVMANAPAEAQTGLQTALDSVRTAQNTAETAASAADQAAGERTDDAGDQAVSPDGQDTASGAAPQ